MAMRFDLLERSAGGESWQPVAVPYFGIWQKSDPGRPGLIYSKRVGRLLAPASYRVVVRFRWYDDEGQIVRTARRGTRVCTQPDWRPDLVVDGVEAGEPGPRPGTIVYRVALRNTGRVAATAFEVVLAVDGVEESPARLEGIPAKGRTTIDVMGPACAPGSVLRIALDARSEVDEAAEPRDATEVSCPMAPAPSP
jgi:hypothetical protein